MKNTIIIALIFTLLAGCSIETMKKIPGIDPKDHKTTERKK